MPDISVRAAGRDDTLRTVLRGGRHVLVLPATGQAGLRGYRHHLDIVTRTGAGPVVLVRPDGYVAARAGGPAICRR
jgi:hypothetical protein